MALGGGGRLAAAPFQEAEAGNRDGGDAGSAEEDRSSRDHDGPAIPFGLRRSNS
jgi:hypothetical protein